MKNININNIICPKCKSKSIKKMALVKHRTEEKSKDTNVKSVITDLQRMKDFLE